MKIYNIEDFTIDVSNVGPFGEKTKYVVTHDITDETVTHIGPRQTTTSEKALEAFKTKYKVDIKTEEQE